MPDWSRIPSGVQFTTPLLVAIGAGVIAIGATLPSVMPALRAVTLSTGSDEEADPFETLVKEYQARADQSVKRFEGRTPFVPPAAPKPPPPPPPPPKKAEPPPPPPPPSPAPAEYDGPQPTGLFADIVFFDGAKVKVGDKYQTVEVLEANSPWRIKLRYTKAGHEPGEYFVTTWKGTTGFALDAPNPYHKTGLIKNADEMPKAGAGAAPGTPGAAEAAARAKHPSGRGSPKSGEPAKAGDEAKAAEAKAAEANGEAGAAGAETAPPETQPANAPPKEGAKANAATDEGKAVVPPARSEGAIEGMSKQQAQSALGEVRDALAINDLPHETRARLEGEAKLLVERLRQDK